MSCVNTVTTTEESNIVTSDQSVSLSDTHNTAAEIDIDLQIKVSVYASFHTPESNIFYCCFVYLIGHLDVFLS